MSEAPLTFSAEWANPSDSKARAGVYAGASGVDVWARWGPSHYEEWGRRYSWEEWFEAGNLEPGSPPGTLLELEALGRRLGHHPAPPPSPPRPARRRRAAKSPPAATWSAATRKLLQWSPGSTAELRERAVACGLHWVVPIGTTTYGCWIGVRILGGVPLERCPVVLCFEGNAATVATELRDSLAMLLWYLGPRDSQQDLQQVRSAWDRIEDEVLEQSAPFGGPPAVQRFADFLRALPEHGAGHEPGLAPPLAETAALVARLDPLQAGFRDQVVALGARREPPDVPIPRAWHEALAATRFVLQRGDSERAWAVAQGPPSLDTGVRLTVQHFVSTKMDWSGADLRLAAEVALRTPRSGPLARALRAQHEATWKNERYDGLVHLEAAADAALANDPATAWTLLAGAGYWTYRRHGRANPVLLEAARQLCVDAGWSEGPWFVE